VNRDPADNPSGIPFKLAMESCHAGFDVDDVASIFEEHFMCRSLTAWYCASSQTDGCTVYVEDERKFMFVNVLIGSRVSARFKLRNSSKVLLAVCCRVYVCMYVCMRAFITRRSYSLSSHECAPVGQTEKMCL